MIVTASRSQLVCFKNSSTMWDQGPQHSFNEAGMSFRGPWHEWHGGSLHSALKMPTKMMVLIIDRVVPWNVKPSLILPFEDERELHTSTYCNKKKTGKQSILVKSFPLKGLHSSELSSWHRYVATCRRIGVSFLGWNSRKKLERVWGQKMSEKF